MRVFFASALLFASATLANAQAYTNWAQIADISGGWTLDTMAVFHASNFVNVGCDVTGGGYATEPNDPGHDLFHTLIMADLPEQEGGALPARRLRPREAEDHRKCR
jgi:hypothetical protein